MCVCLYVLCVPVEKGVGRWIKHSEDQLLEDKGALVKVSKGQHTMHLQLII